MRHVMRIGLILALLGLPVTAASAATTAEQLVGLTRAGLSDDILISLIQTDGSRFQLSADDILKLHNDGLSDAVIRAMQATVRRPEVRAAVAGPTTTQATTVDPAASAPVVNVYQTVTQHVDTPNPAAAPVYPNPYYGFFSFPIAVPVYVAASAPVVYTPVYWGWGGTRRPDTWRDDHVIDTRPSATQPVTQQVRK
jgi:hypothetical protein